MQSLFSQLTRKLLATLVVAGVFLLAVFFLMYGTAMSVSRLFVTQPWLGWIITGGVFFLAAVLFCNINFAKKPPPSLLQQIAHHVNSMNFSAWMQQHPYQATSAAAAAGFIAAGQEPADITEFFRAVIVPLLVTQLQPTHNSE